MRRDLNALTSSTFDLLVIGGGIYGASVAWEAALRGLTVALVERADFGGATSANSLKTIHGGLRYLQHADLARMRESVRERSALMRIAPHLVHPLPCLIPTYGHGMKGREVMTLGLLANDLLSLDQNRPADPQKRIPRGRVIGREECLRLLPGVEPAGLTGGAIFYDAQAYNTERLVLAFLRSAAERGAQAANYTAVTGLVREGGRVVGVELEDRLGGARLTARARAVVNTAGPWVNTLVRRLGGAGWPEQGFAKALNLITRPLFGEYAVGLSSKTRYLDSDAVLKTGSRFFFVAPWRGLSMIGTAYYPFAGHPDSFAIEEEELREFIDEFNQAYPRARLSLDDVRFVHAGLVPSTGTDPVSGSVQLQKQYRIHDHAADGAPGLLSVVGVKYTTARDIAVRLVDRLARQLGRALPRSASAQTPLHGGQIASFGEFLRAEQLRRPQGLSAEAVRQLILAYGSAYGEPLRHLPRPAGPDGEAMAVLEAQAIYAAREEMAQTLADVVFRRTELGSAGRPDGAAIRHCAAVMGRELGWGPARVERELDAVDKLLRGAYDTGKRPADLADPAVQPIGVEAAEV